MKVGLFIKGRYGWIVSTSERLQCYAYTACTIILVLPEGYKIEDVCSPVGHISIRKVVPLEDKQTLKDGDYKQSVDAAPVTATPLGSNPLHLRSNTQLSDAVHSQRCVPSQVVDADRGMSPTLPWSNHDCKDMQGGKQQSELLGNRTHKSLEPETDEPTAVIVGSRHSNHPSDGGNEKDLDEELAKNLNGMPFSGQPNTKGGQLGSNKPHAAVHAPNAPCSGQGDRRTCAQTCDRRKLCC